MRHLHQIVEIDSESQFQVAAMEIFKEQYLNNTTYRSYCDLLNINPKVVNGIEEIPFLPIQFFKTHNVKTGNFSPEKVFLSSGTTAQLRSRHSVKNLSIYEESFKKAFSLFYGNIRDYCILALLPSYMERDGSSLIYMVEQLVKDGQHAQSGFYLNNIEKLVLTIKELEKKKQKTLLIGVSFALLELAEKYQLDLKHTVVMETGGMKGRRKELTRQELHALLNERFGTKEIHSEYGMTELLSQAYSKGDGVFTTPPWMKVFVREVNDPLALCAPGKLGGINVIDLANIHSCSFIATQDLGRIVMESTFSVEGRFDNSDLRGCNLMIN